MKPSEIESWAHSVMDRVERKDPIEDARVEVKAVWIDAQPMARRLAGHANAARGERILWLIGVDEKAGTVPGAEKKDAAEWWPRVQARFDGIAPRLTDLAVPHREVTVMALLF